MAANPRMHADARTSGRARADVRRPEGAAEQLPCRIRTDTGSPRSVTAGVGDCRLTGKGGPYWLPSVAWSAPDSSYFHPTTNLRLFLSMPQFFASCSLPSAGLRASRLVGVGVTAMTPNVFSLLRCGSRAVVPHPCGQDASHGCREEPRALLKVT